MERCMETTQYITVTEENNNIFEQTQTQCHGCY